MFSGEYIYFYSMENANLLTKAKKKLEEKSLSDGEENELNQLEYVDYFFIKGCQQIQNYNDYKKMVGSAVTSEAFEDEQEVLPQIRITNSLQQVVILEFKSMDECNQFKFKILEKANQIDQMLGKLQNKSSDQIMVTDLENSVEECPPKK